MRNRTQVAQQKLPSDIGTGLIGTDATDIELDVNDKQITLEGDLSLEQLRDSLNSTVSHNMDDPAMQKFIADSNFMEEQVLVRVHTSTDKNAEKIVEVFCNGTPQRFIRGEWTICRRKYVGVLAHAKPFSISTPETTDGNGDRTTRIDKTVGLQYPFEMKDKNPIGQAWLARLLQEA